MADRPLISRSPIKLRGGNFYKEGRAKRLTNREVLLEIEWLEVLLEVSQAALRETNKKRGWWTIFGRDK